MKEFSYEAGFHIVGMMFSWTVGPVGVGVVLVCRIRRLVGVRGRVLGRLWAAERAEDGREPGPSGWSWVLSPSVGQPSAGTPAGTKRNNRKSGMSHFAEHL